MKINLHCKQDCMFITVASKNSILTISNTSWILVPLVSLFLSFFFINSDKTGTGVWSNWVIISEFLQEDTKFPGECHSLLTWVCHRPSNGDKLSVIWNQSGLSLATELGGWTHIGICHKEVDSVTHAAKLWPLQCVVDHCCTVTTNQWAVWH